ncbi:MAG: chemotaxis protein CheX [Oscillospiraceae bacterium]|nr:chemotaxis protein CheX [Oscillospiraceae bacterium]
MDFIDSLGVIFSDALAEIIATATGVYIDCIPPEIDSGFEELTGVMGLCGKKGGILFISAKKPDIRTLCSCMIGAPESEVTEADIEDALCEFVNMTAGNAKLRISNPDYMFNLSSPFIIRSKDISIAAKNRTRVISKLLGNGDISVKLTFVC